MGNTFTVQDLDKFLASPSQAAQQPKTAQPQKAAFGPPKQPIPDIQTGADLDKFLAQPIQSFDTTNVQKQHQTTFQESVGEHIPDKAMPALRWWQKYLVDPFEKAAAKSAEIGGDILATGVRTGIPGVIQGTGESPVIEGVARGVGEVIGGAAGDPRNWPFFGSGAAKPLLQRLISGGFGVQMTVGTIQAARNLIQNWGQLTPEQRAEEAAKTGLSAAMTYGAVSHALSSHVADQVIKDNPSATPEQVREKTRSRLEQLRTMPAAERAQELKAMGFPLAVTDDHFQAALDHISARRADRMEAPPHPPEKIPFREGPEYYELNVHPMTPEERTARIYSLETAREHLDAERAAATKEQDAKDAAEKERQRIVKDRQEQAHGEADYRATRAGRLVVQDRRPLQFNTKAAEANYSEHERLAGELEGIATEHQYTDAVDMLQSLRTEKTRGKSFQEKYGEEGKPGNWADDALKMDARRREYLRLSDPKALEPTKTEIQEGIATDMRLAEREQNMRNAADKLDAEAKKNVTDPEVFEKAKAEADEARKLAEDLRTQREQAAARRAAQVAERQIYPMGPPIDLYKVGKQGWWTSPAGRRYGYHYAIVYGDQVIPSHNPMTFAENEDYQPKEMQPRKYHVNREAQAGVEAGGSNPEPDRFHSDDPSGHNGPPFLLKDGKIPGGNGRFMRAMRAYQTGTGDVIYRDLRGRLAHFELGDELPAIDRKPILVRVLDDDVELYEDLVAMGRDMNRTETMGFDEAEAAVIAGRAMTPQMIEWATGQMDALGDETSIRDLMRARAPQIIQQMLDSGMIEPTKRAAYVRSDGGMTETAKLLFENAWIGKYIDDPDLLNSIPDDIKLRLTRAVPGGMKAKAAGSDWDIAPEVKSALKLWEAIANVREDLDEIGKPSERKTDSLVDKYLHPEDFQNGTPRFAGMEIPDPHPTVEAIAKILEKPQVQVRDAFNDYGNSAEGTGSQGSLMGLPPEPVGEFNRAIGSRVDIQVKADQWTVPLAEPPREVVAKAEEPVQRPAEPEVAPPPPLGEFVAGALPTSIEEVPDQHWRDAIADDARRAEKFGVKPNPRAAVAGAMRDAGFNPSDAQERAQAIADRLAEAPAPPPPLGEIPPPSGNIVDKLREVMRNHPGYQSYPGEADDLIYIADVIVHGQTDKSLDEVFSEKLLDVRTEGGPGEGGLEQATGPIAAWAKSAGRRLQIIPFGEQLQIFGGAEPQFMLKIGKGNERLVLKSELLKLRSDVPQIRHMVDAEGNLAPPDLVQGDLFGAPPEPGEGDLFGPGDDEGPQGSLFQAAPRDLDADLKTALGKSKSVGSKEGDFFDKAKAELFPGRVNLSPSEIGQVSARALEMRKASEPPSILFQTKPGPWLYKSAGILEDAKLPNLQGGDQWAALLKNRGVKADELKWLGVDEFLAGKKKVTRQELQDFIRENQFEVTEKALSGERDEDKHFALEASRNQLINDLDRDYNYSIDRTENGYDVNDDGVRWLRADDRLGYPKELEGKGAAIVLRQILALDNQLSELSHGTREQTKYSQYTLPGDKKNYTELLMTMPVKSKIAGISDADVAEFEKLDRMDPAAMTDEQLHRRWELYNLAHQHGTADTPMYIPPHFGGEPNLLAHVRFDERTDASGNRVLFVEEVQSDWHQKGKKEGYVEERTHPAGWADPRSPTSVGRGVPDAPFKTDWHELVMKRMLREAVERGYDKIAWITGEQTADRYDLSKTIKQLVYNAPAEGSDVYHVTALTNEGKFIDVGKKTEAELADVLPKDVIERMRNREGEAVTDDPKWGDLGQRQYMLSGLELKTGGEWASALYDRAIPNFMSKYGKKWGARVGETSIGEDFPHIEPSDYWGEPAFSVRDAKGAEIGNFKTREAAQEFLDELKETGPRYRDTVHSMEITPEMRKSVTEGQNLFQPKKGMVNFLEDGKAILYLYKTADASTFLHEFFHIMRRNLRAEDLKILEDWQKV
jgi:hypothetical protein